MAKNPIKYTAVILERNNVLLGLYTNNLGAYEAMYALIPATVQQTVCSYSTVNRHVVKQGDSYDVPTIIGIFTIRKAPVFRFFPQSTRSRSVRPAQTVNKEIA